MSIVPWFSGSLVHWFSGSLVRWFGGQVVQWSSGPVVKWSSGPVVQWFIGSLVQWYSGSVFSVQCSMLNAQSSKFYVQRSLFSVHGVHCSVFKCSESYVYLSVVNVQIIFLINI